ncbi:MAG: response regulator transcription factor [Clostridia bacterium]|nr:response regulator transcription factor [Clostridia bacterium]
MRLLVAEDERSLSKAIVAILEKNHYAVDAVYDGAEALDYITVGQYDAVIMDIMMPKMDGIAVLQAVRRQGNAVPIILLTAKSEIDDKVLGLDSGANDYITKPFAVKELLARLRVVTRSTEANDSVLRFGNVTLDRASFELTGPSGRFRLANKEFQMMEMLMQRPSRLISSEHFLERVWGYDSDAELNVVWVYISYLRKKLAAIGANITLRAQRNAGYSLEESV